MIQANAINITKAKSVYCQENLLVTGPIRAAPAKRPMLEMVMYKVNWVAETFFQQHCMAIANMPMLVKTYSI